MFRFAFMTIMMLLAIFTAGCVNDDHGQVASTSSAGNRNAAPVTAVGAMRPTDDDDDDDDEDDDTEIPLADVPEAVKSAAVAAVPGLVLEKAEREMEDGVLVYGLIGSVGDEEYEVEVDASGNVLEVETGEDD